ncbi:RNA pseudouridine synthase [bacterium]|nr:RNA pseudouridine synthase [bacterium]|tara:strand:- start:958 stop:1725 length:768 start_codon:yes stop_codon:yes gene_type:complete
MNQESGIKNISIIYEDEDIVAVNKPSGIAVHGDGMSKELTVADWILARYPDINEVGESVQLSNVKCQMSNVILRPGIVHRLDKDTSGVMVVAKNQKTFLSLKKQFQDRGVQKEYRAIVYGVPKEKKGVIDLPIGRSAKDFRTKSTTPNARGEMRESVTEYNVLSAGKDFSSVAVFPHTGRTHQIRVHLKSIGHPVVCDKLYAPKRKCPEETGRLALHAHILTVKSPEGALLHFEAPLPEDFKRMLTALFRLQASV